MDTNRMTNPTGIQGNRIEQARRINGLTQTELGLRVGVNQSAIAQYETGRSYPSESILKAIADTTGFLPTFFGFVPVEGFSQGSLAYRAQRSVTAKEEDHAYQHAKLMYEHVCTMSKSFVLPLVRIPTLKEKPEICAAMARSALELSPDSPIRNLTVAIERQGALILRLPVFLKRVDAFSTWVHDLQGRRPLIAQSSGKPGDRVRFSLAHELGHLIMHNPPKNTGSSMEKEANDFASAFLLPKNAITNELIPPISLMLIAELKVKWGVSMQAIIYRAKDLGIITDRQAAYLFSQIAARGWKMREPANLDIAVETPQLFRKMAEGLYERIDKYARDMGLQEKRASELTVFASVFA